MSEAGADQQVNGAIQEGRRANTYPKGCQDVAFTVHHRYPEMTRKKRLEQMFRNAVEVQGSALDSQERKFTSWM